MTLMIFSKTSKYTATMNPKVQVTKKHNSDDIVRMFKFNNQHRRYLRIDRGLNPHPSRTWIRGNNHWIQISTKITRFL
jgi:hypothetical protein